MLLFQRQASGRVGRDELGQSQVGIGATICTTA